MKSQKSRGAPVDNSRRSGERKDRHGARLDGARCNDAETRGPTAIGTRAQGAPGKARLRSSRCAKAIGARVCQLIVTLSHVGPAASAVEDTLSFVLVLRRLTPSRSLPGRDRGDSAPGKVRPLRYRGAMAIGARAWQLIVTCGVSCFAGG